MTPRSRERRLGRLALIAQEPTDRVVVRMSPPEAERVACWVGINLVALGGGQIVGCLQQASTELDCLGVGAYWVIDVQIEMDLLWVSIRPFRWDVVGRELNADHPAPVRVEDAVKRVIDEDAAAEHARPKSALGGQVSRVEHNYLSRGLHADIFAGARSGDLAGRIGANRTVTKRRVEDAA